MKKLRWGILGAADIARQNWRAIFDSGNSVVVAVASRAIERSEQFIQNCQVENTFEVRPKAYDNYQQLIDAPDIDAVYIPLPTGLRKQWVLRAAKAGKHVICEKPCGLNLNDCARNGRYLPTKQSAVYGRRYVYAQSPTSTHPRSVG